jgi:hypothetical protein
MSYGQSSLCLACHAARAFELSPAVATLTEAFGARQLREYGNTDLGIFSIILEGGSYDLALPCSGQLRYAKESFKFRRLQQANNWPLN